MVSSAPLIGQRVRITGLNSRPELNGKEGVAESFNTDTGRYNVFIDGGELVALLPARVELVRGGGPGGAGAAGAGGIADRIRAGWTAAVGALHRLRLRAGVEPQHLAAGLTAILVLIMGWSLINAGLVGLLLLAGLWGARREGGLGVAARDVGLSAAALLERVTGQRVTPAQAWFLVAAVTGMAYHFWLAPSPATGWATGGSSAGDGTTRRTAGHGGFESSGATHDSHGYFGSLSSLDLGYMLSVGVLGTFAWNLGGGGTPAGWSWGELVRRVQQMDIWQLLMLSNLLQQVLGGGRNRRGYGGMGYGGMGYGRRRGFF